MISVMVTFENGDYLMTKFNGSEEEAKAYYIGNPFNFGVDTDKMVKAVGVELVITYSFDELMKGD
jgi:ethanolamine utilization microcompartment shell protein EutL